MPRTPFVLALLVTALVALGCTKSEPPRAGASDAAAEVKPQREGVKASCDMTKEVGSCNEYAKLTQGLEKGLCNGLKGIYVEGAGAGCPAANDLGTCALEQGEVKHYYGLAVGSQGYTTAAAQADCESQALKGKFTSSAR